VHMVYILNLIDQYDIKEISHSGSFIKFPSHDGEVFFLRYVNSIGPEIDGSDLICAPMSHVYQICSFSIRKHIRYI
jgi:hypothetical protein